MPDLPRRRVLGPADPAWPAGFELLASPPEQLYVAGELGRFDHAVAIVGTRRADPDALDFTYDLAAELAGRGVVVVSGGARGIDRAAHEGALDAGGRTVAVLASGIDPPYPRDHRALFARIADAGAVISEQPDGTPPHPGRFLDRNRLVAAAARTLVVVQTPARSGALSTARWARKLERTVFAVPSVPWDPRGTGCLSLIQSGARVCTRARDVLSVAASQAGEQDLPAEGRTENNNDYRDLDADGQRVLASLGPRALTVDEIVQRTAIPADRVQRSLLTLLLLGSIEERGVGRYRRLRSSL